MDIRIARRTQITVLVFVCFCASARSYAQPAAALQGRVLDESGAVLQGASITVRDNSTRFSTVVDTDRDGRYYLAAIPAGAYEVKAAAPGFRPEIINSLIVDAGRTLVRDFQLSVGTQQDAVIVHAEVPLIDRATATVGHVVSEQTIQGMPLNGRHFMDLALLVPGAVAPSQTGFSSRPIRGIGTLAFNIAGNREEAVGFVVNGVSTNNLTFGSLIFEPPLGSIHEFKADNPVFDAEAGHVSGAVVNIVTRAGSDGVSGELFEFVRNDALDARNFFEFASPDPEPFQRNQFGGSLGGRLWPGRTFFFGSYEGFRQRQRVDMNSLVLSDEERAAATNPIIRQLIPLIPRANFFTTDGTPRFVGSAPAVVEVDRVSVDGRHSLGTRDRVHAFWGHQHLRANEPGTAGTSIPGFGVVLRPLASILTIDETHTFGAALLNEARFGRSSLIGGTYPAAKLNPATVGIANGVTRAIGLPQLIVAGDLNFGGPAAQPQGRVDTSYVVNDTFTRAAGRHVMKVGGEYRHFINENFAEGTGAFNFPSMSAFLAATANAFNITLGERRSAIDQRALSLFLHDRVSVHDTLTLDLGLRYEWHVTPVERDDKFVVFDPEKQSLLRVGVDTPGGIYRQNNRNFEPRVGIAWDVSRNGHTVVRAAYARAVDEPGTTGVRDTAGNPPFAMPLTRTGTIPLESALDSTRPAGLAPATVDRRFHNASMDWWNLNVQRKLRADTVLAAGYLGSRGAHLRLSRNINQPVGGVRPFPAVSAASPIRPDMPLGNITQVESSGFSTYNAAWAAVTKRLSRGFQFDASYTWSKSLDTNSLNSSGFAIQDANNISNEYGLSDFDARHRFVLSGMWDLPFTGHALSRGWQIAAVVQSQSGNPVNIVTSSSTVNGVPNTVRPDVTGPVRIVGSVDQWFDPSTFVAVDRFGTLGRNAVTGPAFHNVDASVIKNIRPGAGMSLQLRVDAFDVFNHPNFGPPGNIVGTPGFGRITRTRLPTGEAGSSRQIQLAARLSFAK